MKKEEFAKLALMGLASGILSSNGIQALQDTQNNYNLIAKGCSSIADKCGSKCNHVAGKCGSKCNSVAGKCGSKCNSIAEKCSGKNGCNGVASGCSGKNGCSSAVAGGCSGKNGCSGIIAENEAPKSLTKPAPIPKDDYKKQGTSLDPNEQNIGYHLMTEDELTLELNDEMLKVYQQMTPEAKALSRLVASARCNGTNECKGLNACKTDTNSCAGKGGCKGLGKCAISDKNLAVRLVAEKMKAKRQGLTK